MPTLTEPPIIPPLAFRAVAVLTVQERDVFGGWISHLNKLIERSEETGGALRGSQLDTHLSSALVGAFHAMRDTCLPLKSALVAEAAERLKPFYPRPGDAWQVASETPAAIAFRDFIAGPPLETTVNGLTRQARAAVALLGMIVSGEEFWRYQPQPAAGGAK